MGMIYEQTLFGNKCIGWTRKWIDLKIIHNRFADSIIKQHHYSGKPTKNRFLSMGVFKHGTRKLQGAIQLGYGIRPKMKHTWGVNVNELNSVEFDRMWLTDELPKFSETIVLSCLQRFLKKVYPQIKYILSYADGSVGNKGIIYQAGNYKKCGELKADFYILSNGERVHPITMWHRHKSRAWDLLQKLYPGIKKADGKQYRYIFEIKS